MVIFISSAEDTYSHCQPWFWKSGGRRSPSLQAIRWHYAVAHKFPGHPAPPSETFYGFCMSKAVSETDLAEASYNKNYEL